MVKQIRIFVVLLVTLLLLTQPTNAKLDINAIEGTDLFLPDRVEVEVTLNSGTGNDIFFQSNVDNALLTHGYTSSESPFNLYSYDGKDKTGPDFFNALDVPPATATDPNALYHASNASSFDLDLKYEVTYYDLTRGKEGLNALENIMLFEDEMSAFRFNAEENSPLILDLKIKGNSETQDMDIFLVSESGEVFDYSTITDVFQTFVNEFIPIVPRETGLYTLYLSPINEDIILQSFKVHDNPPITEIESGYSARWTGLDTQTIFFKFELGNETNTAEILRMSSEIFDLPDIDPTLDQEFLLGNLELSYFTPLTGPFGDSLPATIIQWTSSATFVAVTATPPNESNQFVASAKEERGINPGFEKDYAFWAEKFELDEDEFNLNTDVVVNPVTQPNSNTYFFSTSEDLIIGINSTNGATASILNLDDQDMFYLITSGGNDILNVATHAPTLLPAGNYLIGLSDVVAIANEAQIHTFSLLDIALGDTITRGLRLDEPVFYRLPVPFPVREYFNITYTGGSQFNASVDVNFRLYDSEFNFETNLDELFEEWYAGGTVLQLNNWTEFGSTSTSTNYNIQSGYMKIAATANEIYNPNGSVNGTNVLDHAAVFEIERLNYLDFWETGIGQDNLYENNGLSQSLGSTVDLDGTKDNLIYAYNFASSATPTGYGLSFTSTNVTYRVISFVDWSDEWFDVLTGAPVLIDGIPNYMIDLEFGTNMETAFGFIVLFNNPAANGTFMIEMQQMQVETTPGVDIGSINTIKYNTPYDVDDIVGSSEDNFLEDNLMLIGGGAVALVAVAGVLVILRRRGGAL